MLGILTTGNKGDIIWEAWKNILRAAPSKMKTPYSSTYKIGQVTLTCVTVQGNSCEAQIDWVQPNRGFDPLIGRCPEFDNKFPFSEVRLGTEAETQPIVFDPTDKVWIMKEGKSYVALVGWDPQNPKIRPEIKCLGDKAKFDAALEELKRQFWGSQQARKVPEKVIRLMPTPVKSEDITRYRVSYQNRSGKTVFAGTSKEIVLKFTEMWKQDPRQNLESDRAIWEKKGEEDRYKQVICPELPAPPAMLIASLKKQAVKPVSA